MKKILKLCLMTTVLASCGCIDAMATTTHTVTGAVLAAGTDASTAGAVMTVNSGHTVSNEGTFTTAGVYNEGVAIDVMAGSCSEIDSGKIQAGALTGIITGASESAGTVTGYVARYHDGDDLKWVETALDSKVYGISTSILTSHGFISNNLTLTDAKGAGQPDNKFYEAIDSDNKLYQLYRDVDASTKKIASDNTVKLSAAVRQGSIAPDDEVSIGGATLHHYGYDGDNKIGEVIYVKKDAINSIDPQAAFVIDLTADTGATSGSYSIDAILQNADGLSATSSTEDITSINVTTGTKTLSFTGGNNFKGYDGTAQKKVIALNIGDASTAGKVTFGGSEGSDNGADVAMNGIGDVTVTNDSSVLTLTKGQYAKLTTAGNWTFNGNSKLDSSIPMEIAAGNKITFGA